MRTQIPISMTDIRAMVDPFLCRAEEMFGEKISYEFEGVDFKNHRPCMIQSKGALMEGRVAFEIILCGKATTDRTDAIFQLSHEVVHLISPVEIEDGTEANFLEEGMATYFSKIITAEETGEEEYAGTAIAKGPDYQKAMELYEELRAYDEQAVKKLRKFHPIIATLTLSISNRQD
jgi:hypothetical protein